MVLRAAMRSGGDADAPIGASISKASTAAAAERLKSLIQALFYGPAVKPFRPASGRPADSPNQLANFSAQAALGVGWEEKSRRG